MQTFIKEYRSICEFWLWSLNDFVGFCDVCGEEQDVDWSSNDSHPTQWRHNTNGGRCTKHYGKLGSISPTFYAQLSPGQIPQNTQNFKKYSQSRVFFPLLRSARVKAACKMLVKLTPGANPTKLHFNHFLIHYFFIERL